MSKELIDQYESAADLPAKAIAGLTREELNAHPIPGTWSIQEVVMHLMDSDLIASDRFKRTIAEPKATILAYDESAFAKKLFYDRLDPVLACEIFRLNRRMTAHMLRQLPADAWQRVGHHSERGPETLTQLVGIYTEHVPHHLRFVAEKRKALGR